MVDLAHAVHGPKDGPVVVLLHGFPLDRRMWRFQIGALTGNGYRLILPDLVGHGQTDPVEITAVDTMADDVAALLERLHIPKAIVAGFSMGGYVALALAERHPQRLAGLILLDTRAGADSAEAKAKRNTTLQEVEERGTRVVAAAMAPKMFTEATRTRQRLLAEEVRDMMLKQSKLGVMAAIAALRDRPDRTPALRQIQVPTLILVGDHDAVTPPSEAQAMAAAVPGAKLVTIPGAAHLAPMEQPEAVTTALLDWLDVVAPVPE
jgi:3-oxoadipate enol-lactonase